MRIEDRLLAKGYTQQEINDLAPLLSKEKFRKDLEAELDNGEKALKDLDEYDKWFTNEITPQHQQLIKDVADAKADAAAAKARMEHYQKLGMKSVAGDDAVKAAADADAAAKEAERKAREAGVDMSKYVTADTFNKAFEKTGDAMAIATNIVATHMQLFPGQFIDMEQLLQEARAAKKPIKDYWATKYNVEGRRKEIADKAKADDEARVRADERAKVVAELGSNNPSLQVGGPSANPFVIRKRSEATKQPWERTPNDMVKDRVDRAIKKAVDRGELVTT